MARTTSPDPHPHSLTLLTLSRVIPSLARRTACHGVNPTTRARNGTLNTQVD